MALSRLWNLYWCSTADGDENWFVLARSELEAAAFHNDQEGYDDGDAHAELVCPVPEELHFEQPGWPSMELLDRLGTILRAGSPRVVQIDGHVYSEGPLDDVIMKHQDDQFEAQGKGRPNGTIRPSDN